MVIGISLGWNCDAASWGVRNDIRSSKSNGYLTCPFDIMISNYNGMIQCLKDDFKYFLDDKYLRITKSGYLINTHYNFFFLHESFSWMKRGGIKLLSDFKTEDHFTKNNYENLKDRYSKRADNFRNYLHSKDKIIFIINRVNKDISELITYLDTLNINYEIRLITVRLTEKDRIEEVIEILKISGLTDEEINRELDIQ